MILLCSIIDLKSILWYKFLIFYTYHPNTVFTRARMWGSVAGFLSQKGFASKNVWETLTSTIPEALCSKELRGTIWPNYDDYEIVKSDHSRGSNFATFISSRWKASAQSIENIFCLFVNFDVESTVRGDRSNLNKWNKVTETLLQRIYFLNPLRLMYGSY
jgi:hypothetical protein